MQLKLNATIGFPGGKVNNRESSREALRRKLIEEIDFDIENRELKPLTTFSTPITNIHSFSLELTYDELIKVRNNSTRNVLNIAENTGTMLAPIVNSKLNEYNNLLEHRFYATARYELEALVEKEQLLKQNP